MSLTLSKKVLVLVTIPVIFEVGMVGVVMTLLAKVEHARSKSAEARQISAKFNTVMGLAIRQFSTAIFNKMTKTDAPENQTDKLDKAIHKEVDEVRVLLAKKPGAFENTLLRSFDTLDQSMIVAQRAYDNGDKATVVPAWIKVQHNADAFFKTCASLADVNDQYQSQARKEMEAYDAYLQAALLASIGASIVLAFGLATAFNRSTSDRLKVLLENSRRFAAGQPPSAKLSGIDELAQLDRSHRETYEALQVLRQKERAILDNAAEIICSLNDRLVISDVNVAVESILGYSIDYLVGRRVIELVDEQQKASVTEFLTSRSTQAVAPGRAGAAPPASEQLQARGVEVMLKRKDGSVLETHWSVSFSDIDATIYCVISDISDRKRLEKAKQVFYNMLTHDLRTPLSSVMISIETLMSRKYGLSAEGDEVLARADKNLKLSLGLINQLLEMEKLSFEKPNLHLDAFSSGLLFSRALAACIDLAQSKNITIAMPGKESNCELIADQERLLQVMINLLGNAVKFTPEGKSIRVILEKLKDTVKISVVDQAKPLDADERSTIFEEFKQGKQDANGAVQPGSGLGLAIARNVVQAHGGRIGVSENGPSGNIFWFELQCEDADA